MATVFIQKNKGQVRVSYAVKFKDPFTGKTKYYKTYPRLRDAQDAANDLRALLNSGKISAIRENRTKINFTTFEQVGESLKQEWLDRNEREELKQTTLDEYFYRLNFLNRRFGKRVLCEISATELKAYQKEILTELSAVSSNRSLFIIKQVFKHGMKIKAVIENVSEQITYLSEKKHERNNYLLPEMIDTLVTACRNNRAKFYLPALIYLGAEHGASRQEALSLEWSDINFDYDDKGIIHFFRIKNGHERTEYLMPRTRKALLEWRDHLERKRKMFKIRVPKSQYVFSHINGEPIQRFNSAWRSVCRVAGFKNLHFHDLRHTFCSNLLLSGADIKRVKEMIGHKDLSMTDRYTHLTLKHKSLCQERLAAHYAQTER